MPPPWLDHVGLGDALAYAQAMPPASVDLVVTSPPYWRLRDYTHPDQWGQERTPEEYVARLVELFRELRRVLKPRGNVLLNLGDTYYNNPGAGSATMTTGNRAAVALVGRQKRVIPHPSIRIKELVGIPWLAVEALRRPYYTGRIKSEAERAWMAAMIDGEGSISCFSYVRLDDEGHRDGVQICVTNASTRLLDECYRIWPTSRQQHNRHGAGHLGNPPTYRWIVHGIENKLLFLRELYPCLIAKRQQALLAYNLLLLMADAKRLGPVGQGDAVREKRVLLTRLVSQANHAADVETPAWCVEPPSLLEPGWRIRGEYIWHKPNGLPETVTDRCTRNHEHVFHLTLHPTAYWDWRAVAEPAKWERWGRQTVKKGPGTEMKSSHVREESKAAILARYEDRPKNRRSVWTIPVRRYGGAHKAVMPVALARLCVLAGCPSGGVVYDPFLGAGTTALAALQLGRHFAGSELLPGSVREAEARIARETGWSLRPALGIVPGHIGGLDPAEAAG